MKKTHFLTMVTAAVLLALAACKPDPLNHLTDGVTVTTQTPEYISGTAAILGAEVTAEDDGLLLELGVCWSLTEKPTIDDRCLKTYKYSQPFTCFADHLEPNTTYHVRGFAKYGTEYCYGEEKTFTTLNDTIGSFPGVLTTTPAHDISAYGFVAGGSLASTDINFNFQRFGICIGESPDLTINNCEYYVEDPMYYFTNPFQIYIDGLYPNTQYYYRAFMAYGEYGHYEYIYGDVLSLTTPVVPFELELYTYYPYYSWGGNYIEVEGYLSCNKPEVIDQVGFCYSDTNEFPQFESDLHTTVATPIGEWYNFGSYIYDLSANTKYYIRSYARYMTDSIKYGNVVSIDTY